MLVSDSAAQVPPPSRSLKEVTTRKYTVVLDVNSVLLHRAFMNNRPDVMRRPGVTRFLNWIWRKANVAFWGSVLSRNLEQLLDVLLKDVNFSARDVIALSQEKCEQSLYRSPTAPSKPVFLKELATFANIVGLSSLDDILLIDDSPLKNLMNDSYSAVFPPTFRGDENDSYLLDTLLPWLDGLFKSNEEVAQYVQNHALFGGQSLVDPMSREGYAVLQGTMPE